MPTAYQQKQPATESPAHTNTPRTKPVSQVAYNNTNVSKRYIMIQVIKNSGFIYTQRLSDNKYTLNHGIYFISAERTVRLAVNTIRFLHNKSEQKSFV